MEGSAAVLAPLAIAALVAIYFLPSMIAGSRGHMSASAIVALNVLAGWTALGWILALVWSLNSNTRENFHYLATGERPSPTKSAPRIIESAEPSSGPSSNGKSEFSRLMPVIVLGVIALFGVAGWLVLRAEKAHDESTLQATAERIATEHEAAERATRKRVPPDIDALNRALDGLKAHNSLANH